MECYGEEMAFRQKRPFSLSTATFPNNVIKFLFCDAISCPFLYFNLIFAKRSCICRYYYYICELTLKKSRHFFIHTRGSGGL